MNTHLVTSSSVLVNIEDTQQQEQQRKMMLEDEKTAVQVRDAFTMEMRVTSDGQIRSTTIEKQGKKLPQWYAAIIATFMHFVSGYAMGWTSSAPVMLAAEGMSLTAAQIGWIGSLFCIGASLGTPLTGWLADYLGRKNTIILTAVPFIITWLLKATMSHSIIAIYIARICAGVCASALSVVPIMYVAETAEPAVRGTLSSLLIVMFNLGLVIVYAAGAVLNSTLILALLGLAPVLIALIPAVTWLPESPVSLINKGRISEARASLLRLRGPHYDIDTELQQIQVAITADREAAADVSLVRLLRKSRGLRQGLYITLCLMTCQQLCGISAVISYAASIFSASGTNMDPNMCAVAMGILQLVSTIICSALLDKAGRRPLIIGSSFVVVLSLAFLGGYLEIVNAGIDASSFSWIPLVAISLYCMAFAGGLGPVPWVLVGEVFPVQVRGISAALVGMWAWGQAFLVTLIFPPLLEMIGISNAVWVFTVGGILTGLFCIIFCPETKGKPLQQILNELEGIRPEKFIT